MPRAILAIDQGTTSTRALVFGADQSLLGTAQEELPQIYPQSGWVEHDPEAIWRAVVATARGAIERAGLTASDIGAIGITNQRETALVWDRARPARCFTMRSSGKTAGAPHFATN